MRLLRFLEQIQDDRSGATAIEYGLIAALIVIAMIGSLNTFASETISMWNGVAATISDANDL